MTQRRIYQEEYPYFVTFRTKQGYSLFEDAEMAVLLVDIMFNAGTLKQYDILAYQIMPEHVHVLVYQKNVDNIHRAQASLPALLCLDGRAPTPACLLSQTAGREGCARRNFNISQLVHAIKSYFCDAIRDHYNIKYPVFQKRFYTRIITTRKYLRTVIQYIKYNPIKAELPHKYYHPPYQYFDWNKISKLF